MKKIKLLAALLSGISLFSIVVPGASQVAYAADNISVSEPSEKEFQLDKLTIVESNDLYKAFVAEVNSSEVKQQLSFFPNSAETKSLIQELIVKYDGAEVKLAYGSPRDSVVPLGNGWTEKFVNGGINEYATSKSGLVNLRSYLGAAAVGFTVNGAAYGAIIGGVLGAVVGTVIGAGVLAKRCDQGQSDVKAMITKGKSNGGVRMTLTEEFPICSINSQTQCGI